MKNKKFLLKNIISPVFVLVIGGLIGWGLNELYGYWRRPLVQIEIVKIADLGLESVYPDVFKEYSNLNFAKIELRSIGKRSAESLSIDLVFNQDIKRIFQIKAGIKSDSWNVRSSNRMFEKEEVGSEYFKVSDDNISEGLRSLIWEIDSFRANDYVQFAILTENSANLETKCDFRLKNGVGNECEITEWVTNARLRSG